MERIYYSRQDYNQLKRKQYEEYIKRQNRYYLYRKRYYEEYIKRQNRYYLSKKKQYEEYVKRQNRYYLNRKKYYEEYIKRQNRYYLSKKKYYEEYAKNRNRYYLYNKKYDEIDNLQREFFNPIKATNIEVSYIEDQSIKGINGYLEANIKERNLEYEKNNSDQYDYLENKSCNSIEESYNDEHLEEIHEECLEEIDEKFIRDNEKQLIEENYEEFLERSNEEIIEEDDREILEENYNACVKEEILQKDNTSIEGIYVNFPVILAETPVILAETNIIITVEDTITLNEEIKGIKEIRKNIFLTQSRLIPFSSSTLEPNSGILFIKGFIRNNIDYETEIYAEVETANDCGTTRHCNFEVPFDFTTRISFIRQPIFIGNTITSELEFVKNSNQVYDIYGDSVSGCDNFEQCLMFTEVFNEKPFVELVKATFIEVAINKSSTLSQESIPELKCTKITEKIIVSLILRVLQKQQLRIEIE